MSRNKSAAAPIIVLFGDERFLKTATLEQCLDEVLAPEADRALALATYDGARGEEQGGPTLAAVFDDLATLPFLTERRVVVIREADRFVSAYREALERYAARPAPTGTLILECKSFPKTTRLYKAVLSAGGAVHECKRLTGRALAEFVQERAAQLGKRIDPAAAASLLDKVGSDAGVLAMELEKLALYVGARPSINVRDVADLVGESREEKIFAVMDAAAAGDAAEALRLWHQVCTTDRDAPYKAVGGIAFKLRNWLTAHRLSQLGEPPHAIAPKVMMYGRVGELQTMMGRLPATRIKRLLAALADLDAQAKSGARSIETGVETLLIQVAGAA